MVRTNRRSFGRSRSFVDTEDAALDDLCGRILGAAIEVHRLLGPGLLESTYERCLLHELLQRGLRAERQKALPIRYKGLDLDEGYRIDLLVEGKIVLELKAVEEITGVHVAQMVTYLKLSGLTIGYLLNFNVKLMKHGIRRIKCNPGTVDAEGSAPLP